MLLLVVAVVGGAALGYSLRLARLPGSSARAAPTADEAFVQLADAMQRSDTVAIMRLTTARGRETLEMSMGPMGSMEMARAGGSFLAFGIDWTKRDPRRAEASGRGELLGAPFLFIQTDEGWKLDGFAPGM